MKKLIVTLAAIAFLSGCASSSRPQYNPQQFSSENYQQNVSNAIEYADNFVDFDQKNFPQANLDAQDFSLLLKADIAFNQGSYAQAGGSYYYLAEKYHDPRLIYKGIICFEHTSVAPEQYARLNLLIQQLIQVAPDSNIAKLFGIRIAIEKNDLATAKKNLKTIIKADPTRARAILLFLATIISNDIDKSSAAATLEKFAAYIESRYHDYPEADLVAVASYSLSANSEQLFASLDKISRDYPNWEIPLYWSASILAKNEKLQLLRLMLEHEIQRNTHPSSTLQNLYIASLIRSDQITNAESYTVSRLVQNPESASLMVDSAIVSYKLGHNQAAIDALLKAKLRQYSLNGAVDLAIASLYDYQGNNESAINYYSLVREKNSLLAPVANMGILRAYLETKRYSQADQFIDSLAAAAKLRPYNAALLKISLYAGLGQNEQAYKVSQQKISLYSFDKSLVYLYASLSGITNRTDQAIKWFNKYIVMNPNDPSGYNDLAFTLADKTSHYLQAKALADKAYQMAPYDPAVLDTLGWTYFKLGQYDKAEEFVSRAYQKTQDHDTALHLKQILLAAKKPELAAKVIIIPPQVEQLQFEQNVLNQSMLLLMYYQFGLDLSR